MTPDAVPSIRTERLDLVSISPSFIEALLDGRREEAALLLGGLLPEGWPDEHDARFLRLRLEQMREDPASQEWLAREMILRPVGPSQNERGVMVGHIGFHGPPVGSSVEIGYTVFEPYRRRGFAEEAVRGLMRWAEEQHGIRTFRLSIAPGNTPSLALAAKLGFEKVGEQEDPEDGLEYVFELTVAGG